MSLLVADRLAKSFGSLQAVDGVSFTVHAGEIYGLLGPDGAGKTSMLTGLLRPDAGTVTVDGVPAGWVLDALHQLISLGSGLDAVVTPLLVLTACAVAATAAAAKFFRV